jgi:cell pole-organizing protein PopZ
MHAPGREPSMEDILASIKKVIAEEKDLRGAADMATHGPGLESQEAEEEDVLNLDQPIGARVDLSPPLLDEQVAETARHSLDELTTVAATVPPPPQVNPLEEMVREMLRPMLKQWLDENLPEMVSAHVRREISRITGRPV